VLGNGHEVAQVTQVHAASIPLVMVALAAPETPPPGL
jgi:hypothetical protein